MSAAKYSVRLLVAAENDLSEIVSYIAEDDRAAGIAILERFESSFESLCSNPRLGRVPKEDSIAAYGYRYLVVSNYLIFYVIREHTVVIHRIIHGARNYLDLF